MPSRMSTDIVFRTDRILPILYRELVRTAVEEVRCSGIYGFLGKRLRASSAKEVSNRFQTLVGGTRIKHTFGKASVEMYDKQDRVLRIETTVNDLCKVARLTKDEKKHSCRGLEFSMEEDLDFMLAIMRAGKGGGIRNWVSLVPVRRAGRWITANLKGKITVGEVTRQAGLSSSRLQQFFHITAGMQRAGSSSALPSTFFVLDAIPIRTFCPQSIRPCWLRYSRMERPALRLKNLEKW